MIEERAIIDRLVEGLKNLFDGTDVMVADSMDFDEQRGDAMVVAGFQSRTQINPGLDDYRWTCNILIDVRIDSDFDLHQIQSRISGWLSALAVRGYTGMATVFGDLPVVGILLQPAQWSLGQASNRCMLPLDIITSE